jgi:superfamily II DNA helicase RecQ
LFSSTGGKQQLRFMAIDECHLYASFGIEFRSEFYLLRGTLLEQLNTCTQHNIVILFMTASATKSMVEDLELLTALTFAKPNDVLWPSDLASIMHHSIRIKTC